jgi:hypothetical protein
MWSLLAALIFAGCRDQRWPQPARLRVLPAASREKVAVSFATRRERNLPSAIGLPLSRDANVTSSRTDG